MRNVRPDQWDVLTDEEMQDIMHMLRRPMEPLPPNPDAPRVEDVVGEGNDWGPPVYDPNVGWIQLRRMQGHDPGVLGEWRRVEHPFEDFGDPADPMDDDDGPRALFRADEFPGLPPPVMHYGNLNLPPPPLLEEEAHRPRDFPFQRVEFRYGQGAWEVHSCEAQRCEPLGLIAVRCHELHVGVAFAMMLSGIMSCGRAPLGATIERVVKSRVTRLGGYNRLRVFATTRHPQHYYGTRVLSTAWTWFCINALERVPGVGRLPNEINDEILTWIFNLGDCDPRALIDDHIFAPAETLPNGCLTFAPRQRPLPLEYDEPDAPWVYSARAHRICTDSGIPRLLDHNRDYAREDGLLPTRNPNTGHFGPRVYPGAQDVRMRMPHQDNPLYITRMSTLDQPLRDGHDQFMRRDEDEDEIRGMTPEQAAEHRAMRRWGRDPPLPTPARVKEEEIRGAARGQRQRQRKHNKRNKVPKRQQNRNQATRNRKGRGRQQRRQ